MEVLVALMELVFIVCILCFFVIMFFEIKITKDKPKLTDGVYIGLYNNGYVKINNNNHEYELVTNQRFQNNIKVMIIVIDNKISTIKQIKNEKI